MARLFVTERELNFINDIMKEVVKDVIGQKIYYYSISEIKSRVHDVYEESPNKIFENPIEIDALVKYSGQEVKTNRFGSEEYYNIECYIQERDLIDKQIDVREGDFFSYGETFFEIIKAPRSDVIFGQIEHKSYITVSGKQARKGQFITKVLVQLQKLTQIQTQYRQLLFNNVVLKRIDSERQATLEIYRSQVCLMRHLQDLLKCRRMVIQSV